MLMQAIDAPQLQISSNGSKSKDPANNTYSAQNLRFSHEKNYDIVHNG